MITTIILAVLGLGLGYIGRMWQDYKYRREFVKRKEAEYKHAVNEKAYKIINLYEDNEDKLKNMSRRERLDFIAERVK